MKINAQLLRASWRSWVATDMVRVGPYWLQLMWTLVFCTALAIGFTIVGWLVQRREASLGQWAVLFGQNLVLCCVIGYIIQGLFELFGHWMGRQRLRALAGWRATLYFGSIPLLGVAIGWPVGVLLASGGIPHWMRGPQVLEVFGTAFLIAIMLSFGFHLYFAASAKRVEAEKRATEAQLRLLQAQMEPHFLFNTLANVQSLIDHEPRLAKQMLESFTDYLRATLSQLRRDDSAVAEELALAEAYLKLLATRMSERLRFSIDADDRARSAVLPPLLLQPLVENAVHHGLEPKVEGGQVQLRARVAGDQLVLEVQDDGLGLDAAPRRARRSGAGMALANLRERLATRYGDAARLELSALAPGTLARITLPLETAGAAP